MEILNKQDTPNIKINNIIKSIEDGRKEDGNRSIADKIIKRLHDLEKTVQNNHGRWAWGFLPVQTKRKLLFNIKFSFLYCNRKKRNIWFGTRAMGLCLYDGKVFTDLQSIDPHIEMPNFKSIY